MKKKKVIEKLTITYNVAESATEKDVILLALKGTGIDLTNKEHKEFMHAIAEVISGQMYAKSQNIDSKNIKYIKEEKNRSRPKCECLRTVHKMNPNCFPYGDSYEWDECIDCGKMHNVNCLNVKNDFIR